MSMFPTSSSEIYRNEDGEVVGWSSTYYDELEYCDICGYNHSRDNCPDEVEDEGEWPEEEDEEEQDG